MNQVSGSKFGSAGPSLYLLLNVIEAALQGRFDRPVSGPREGQPGAQDSGMAAREKQRSPQAPGRHAVSVALGQPFDHSVPPKAAQLVAHRPRADLLGPPARKRREKVAKVSVAVTLRLKAK
jgi:hypothetical protein